MADMGIGLLSDSPCEICGGKGKTTGMIFGDSRGVLNYGCNLSYCTEHTEKEVDSFYRHKKSLARQKAIEEALSRGETLPPGLAPDQPH